MKQITMTRSKESDVKKILFCYNSAIKLYDENARADGDETTIISSMKNAESYHVEIDAEVVGWIVWENSYNCSVLKAMYVHECYQGKDIANQMLDFYIGKLKSLNIDLSLLSVLINAPWAIRFYEKNNYILLDENVNYPPTHQKNIREYMDKHNKPWAKNMYRKI